MEQMIVLDNFKALLEDKDAFLSALSEFVFKCPHCEEEFYGKALDMKEAGRVFELLNDFKGAIDYERGKVKLKLTNLIALDVMLEEWDKRVGRGR